MAVEFAAGRGQALPSVLAGCGAKVSFVDSSDTDAFLHGRVPVLPSEYVSSSVDWSRMKRPGHPVDISTDYMLILQDPVRCAAIARLKSELGAAGSELQVLLLFPRVVSGFEQQLDSAIRSQPRKQAGTAGLEYFTSSRRIFRRIAGYRRSGRQNSAGAGPELAAQHN